MKRISRILLILMLGFSVPLLSASGQEKKNEQKIKVIVTGDSGTKTVIDTSFTGGTLPATITLKDGKVIHIIKQGADISHIDSDSKGTKVTVKVSTDLEDGKETEEKVIIMSSDSAKWTVSPAGEKDHIYVYSNSKSTSDKPQKHIIIASLGDKLTEMENANSIIISDGKVIRSGDGKSFGIVVTDEENSDATKYIIAKDGVTVTIESDDEAMAKEIMKDIESKLDAKKDTKADTKKTEKK